MKAFIKLFRLGIPVIMLFFLLGLCYPEKISGFEGRIGNNSSFNKWTSENVSVPIGNDIGLKVHFEENPKNFYNPSFYYHKTTTADRVVVPIHQLVVGGEIRYSIPITFGQTTVETMLDTGSPGIWVLPGAIQPGDYHATTDRKGMGYGSGVTINGIAAKAMITMGSFHSAAPVPIAVVQRIGCDPRHPNCPGSKMQQQDYRLGSSGIPNKGFMAIIGVKLGRHGIMKNPLREMGVQTWIINLPKPRGNQPGELILNPDQNDLSGYTLFHINLTSAPRDGIPSCITNLRTNKQICGSTMLDTGAPGIHIITGQQGNNSQIHFDRGDSVQISFTNGNGKSVPPETFINQARNGNNVKVSMSKNHQAENVIYAGINPFLAYSVLYESDPNMIGLKPRGPEKIVVRPLPLGQFRSGMKNRPLNGMQNKK